MTNCPICNKPLTCAYCTGKAGGKKRNPNKGFGSKHVQDKAQATRKARKAESCKS